MVIALAAVIFVGCGAKEEVEEKVELKTYKDKISYIVGAKQAEMITKSGDPNLERLSIDDMVAGFSLGLSDKQALDKACEEALGKLYGPYGQDFDTNYVKEGCNCIGKLAGSVFYQKWNGKKVMNQFDMKIVKIGFKHGLNKKDTLIERGLASQMYTEFLTDINVKSGKAMMAKAAKLPNIKTLEGGIVVETLTEGTGGSPTVTDDVEVNYILVSAEGDTLENSFAIQAQSGRPLPAFNLGGVIPGWGILFPTLKKGGKYHAYVPWEYAYGEQNQRESLKFYIELVNFGPKGTLVKAPEMAPSMEGMPMQ